MDTPDKNRISAVSFFNVEDSPVFQYINDLSPIEPVKGARAGNNLHSLPFTSPSSLFSSPQLNSYRDSRFSIKRHRSLDLSSPVVLFGQTVKNSPDAREAVKISGLSEEEQLKCRPEQLENVSETKPFKEQINLVIELANSLKNGRDGCDIPMASCDEVPMDAENEVGRIGLIEQSVELCGQLDDPFVLDADSDGVLQTREMEAQSGSGAEEIMFDVAGIQNNEQQNPNITDPRLNSFASEPQEFSLCSGNVEEPGGYCSVQVAAGAPDITLSSSSNVAAGAPGITLSSSSNVAAIASTVKAEDKEETCLQLSRKQRSVRRRCLTFDVGGPYKRIPLRDSTNDLPLDFTSINKAPLDLPQECLDSSKQDTEELLSIPRTIGLHLNGLVNTSVSSDRNKLIFKDGRFFPHGPTTSHHNIEDEFSTPVSAKRDWVSCDNKIMEKAPERSMEGECFDKDMPRENRQLSRGLDELGSCKRCRCRKSKCLKLYCDCFAAGLYCVEPCSCQNCFNKPVHEEMVMKTRRLIEARNPLAFAPKVVSTSDSATDFGEENSKTPASARHMRGCNCKKSGCLKKYCECYLMGVGCSSSCRCIGCKNVFGQKNESDAVTVNEEASKDNGDHGDASSQNEETSSVLERRNQHVLLAFPSLSSM